MSYQHDIADQDARPSCGLERLNPLVRRELLSVLELPDIRELISASPTFYKQFTLDRGYITRESLLLTLGSVYGDAEAVYKSSTAQFQQSRSKETVLDFLETYRHQTSGTGASESTGIPSKDQAQAMAKFHMTTVVPLMEAYTKWALGNLDVVVEDLVPTATQNEAQKQEKEILSSSERNRISRALYRFQLCCNLFGGQSQEKSSSSVSLAFRSEDILAKFCSLFEPWEVEEVLCIYGFAKDKISHVLDTIRWDINKKNPKYDGQRPPTPEGAFDMDNDWMRDSLLEGSISRGLDTLRILLSNLDHNKLVDFMRTQMSVLPGAFLDEQTLSDTTQSLRREQHPSNRDAKEENREPLPFIGDEELYNTGLGPPLAWTILWQETYSNLYGYYIQDGIRQWGYVMWDANRLKANSADEALRRQWELDWEGDDPRDSLF